TVPRKIQIANRKLQIANCKFTTSFPNSVWERLFSKLCFASGTGTRNRSFQEMRSQTEFGNEGPKCKLQNANSQFAFCNLHFAIPLLLAAGFLLLAPNLVLAADTFPRGPGFYFSIPKLLSLLVIYLCWVRTCWWVNNDATELKLP